MVNLNWRFIILGTLVGLVPPLLLIFFGVVALLLAPRPPNDPIPSASTPNAPIGALPDLHVGLQQRVQYGGGTPVAVGVGFLLRLNNETVIGVSTVHAFSPALAQTVSLTDLQTNTRITFTEYYRPYGRARLFTQNLAGDYALFSGANTQTATLSGLILTPDPRGAPTVGERVRVYCAVGQFGPAGLCQVDAIVYRVDAQAVWIALDEQVPVAGFSGAPVVSLHTGQVVGMLVAGAQAGDPLRVGLSPIAAIVAAAEAPGSPLPMANP